MVAPPSGGSAVLTGHLDSANVSPGLFCASALGLVGDGASAAAGVRGRGTGWFCSTSGLGAGLSGLDDGWIMIIVVPVRGHEKKDPAASEHVISEGEVRCKLDLG